MGHDILFASQTDEEEVRALLLDNSLDLSGEIENHVLLRIRGQVCAAAKLALTKDDHYHLEVIGVKHDLHRAGWGSLLLNALTATPWKYCRPETSAVSGTYMVTLMAKEDADAFYEKHGFQACPDSFLAAPYVEKCNVCPDRETCGPTPMVFVGGE